MTLKNSFLTDAAENMKRRNWVFWISFLTFFCYFPGTLVLGLNNIRTRYTNVTDSESLKGMYADMTELVELIFHVNYGTPVLIIALGVLIGMQGFVYLHNKREVDFYHSQPVSRKRRFLMLWCNGIVVFTVTYLVNMVLGMVVAAAYGRMSLTILSGALQGFLLYMALFLGIYHIAILAILLTGNTLVSLLAMVVLAGYEIALRALIAVFSSSFLLTYGHMENEKIFATLLSPIVTFYKYIMTLDNNNVWGENFHTFASTLLMLLVMAVVFGVMDFLLYIRRSSESHGKSISFPKIKEPLRFALLLLIGAFGSYMIYYVAGESILLGMIGAVFSIFLGHTVIQIIYEVDFRSITQKWPTAAISLVAVVLVFLGFKYDWTGYDYKIPKQSRVESVCLELLADGFCDNVYIMQDGTEIYGNSYMRNNMELTDLDTIYELLENREILKKTTMDYDGNYESITVIFRLKNGRKEHRNLYFKYEENMGVLDKIYHMEEYQKTNNQVMEDNFVEDYQIVTATYQNGLKEYEVPSGQVKALIEAYKEDVNNGKYAEVYYNLPVGKIAIKGIGLRNEEYRNGWDVVIYESYKNSMEILESAGIPYEAVFDEAYISDIMKISVEYIDQEKLSQGYNWDESHKTVVYEDPEVYAKILENAVPSANRWWSGNNRSGNNEYGAYIYTPNPNLNPYYGGSDYEIDEVYFQVGEIPEFVLKDLEDAPYGQDTVIKTK